MLVNVLMDIDDTLFPSTEFSALARRNALNAFIGMGYGAEHADLERRLNSIIASRGSNYEKHFNDLCLDLGIRDASRFVAGAVCAYHDTKASIAPYPQVPMTLLRLREKGLKLYAATNGNAIKQWDKLIRLRISHFFDDVFVSETLGVEKGEGFFRKVLSSLGASPGSCLMVGDREDADILPAKALGIRTIRIKAGKHSHLPSEADHIVSDISHILPIVESL